ncbi:GGDEF domain-containing protein [Rhodopseudomonas palustris]|uniref:diguanylate cyclase n=1 Tax=Rhodopseudomonas palustris (strain BisB18) TaxID=316056 RepID=Q211N5_RHOPB
MSIFHAQPEAALRHAEAPASEHGHALDPALEKDRRSPRGHGHEYWLFTITVLNLSPLLIDWIVLRQHFSLALLLRLGVVAPIGIFGLWLCHFTTHTRLQAWATAAATLALSLVATALGQYAAEPYATRYMMAAQFLIFGAAVFTALPWRLTKLMTLIAVAGFALIVSSGLRWPPLDGNLDLVVFCLTTTAIALYLRRRKDLQLAEIINLRKLDSSHASELRDANHKLSLLSHTDPLTGVFNRRYLDRLVDQLAISIAPNAGYGLLMIDVDHFKFLNDRCGHLHGDQCLRLIATAIQRSLRSSDDAVIRYGGEEFAVVLPDADLFETMQVAEGLRAAIGALRIPNPGLGPEAFVSVSIGAYSATTAEDVTDSLRCADQALYCAKQAGRDRVFV